MEFTWKWKPCFIFSPFLVLSEAALKSVGVLGRGEEVCDHEQFEQKARDESPEKNGEDESESTAAAFGGPVFPFCKSSENKWFPQPNRKIAVASPK